MFQIKLQNMLVALLGLAAFALFAPTPAYSQEKVIVTNTASEPVPTVVQGTTKGHRNRRDRQFGGGSRFGPRRKRVVGNASRPEGQRDG